MGESKVKTSAHSYGFVCTIGGINFVYGPEWSLELYQAKQS